MEQQTQMFKNSLSFYHRVVKGNNSVVDSSVCPKKIQLLELASRNLDQAAFSIGAPTEIFSLTVSVVTTGSLKLIHLFIHACAHLLFSFWLIYWFVTQIFFFICVFFYWMNANYRAAGQRGGYFLLLPLPPVL